MITVLIDYGAGNLHSAEKAFQRMALEADAGEIIVTSRAEDVLRADRIVLPGDGAFPACMEALTADTALFEALLEAVEVKACPFLGICVGMQLMAQKGEEYRLVDGLGWIDGAVQKITPQDTTMKVPHMGWNDLVIEQDHAVLQGIKTGDHAYFVHSYQMVMGTASERLASCDYGGPVTAIVGRDTMVGTQFHPEKSQSTGLRLIQNWLEWRP
ncbi:MAG: imidazole glycerol phosphate synthase subunit HisH [Pseudomonadota bacterium]